MSAALPLASLLVLAYFALPCFASHEAACAELFKGKPSEIVIDFEKIVTSPHQRRSRIDVVDRCLENGLQQVGREVIACDPSGPPAPTIEDFNTLSVYVVCNKEICPDGIEVSIKQFCEA